MKSLRLLAMTLLAGTCCASVAFACDTPKSAASATSATSASSSNAAVTTKSAGQTPSVPLDGGCSAVAITYKTAANGAATGCSQAMAAQCTPAMRAACEKNAAVAAAMGCNMKGATSAVTASNTKTGGKCDAKGVAMTSGASCTMHGSTSSAGMEHCAHAKSAMVTAVAAGMICSSHMNDMSHDCSACEDWSKCEQAVRNLGAKAQVVSLKNGVMIVYTAESATSIKGLQSVVAKRNEKMVEALTAGSDKKLCDECKQLRGAMASGKLHREVVNVERGCMTLITSDDRAVVQKIRSMTGQPVAMR